MGVHNDILGVLVWEDEDVDTGVYLQVDGFNVTDFLSSYLGAMSAAGKLQEDGEYAEHITVDNPPLDIRFVARQNRRIEKVGVKTKGAGFRSFRSKGSRVNTIFRTKEPPKYLIKGSREIYPVEVYSIRDESGASRTFARAVSDFRQVSCVSDGETFVCRYSNKYEREAYVETLEEFVKRVDEARHNLEQKIQEKIEQYRDDEQKLTAYMLAKKKLEECNSIKDPVQKAVCYTDVPNVRVEDETIYLNDLPELQVPDVIV